MPLVQDADVVAAVERILAATPGRAADDLSAAACVAIARSVLDMRSRRSRTVVLGICGPQGSGKSTLTAVLQRLFVGEAGLSVVTLSIDDLYLSRAARTRLAQDIHPLLITRGVPGTHDVELGIRVIGQLVDATAETQTRIPRFDKAVDDPQPRERWDIVTGRPDLIVFEGWCVGAIPQPEAALATPVNDLEREFDADCTWRTYVNTQLSGRYQDLFARIDILTLLRAPGFERVATWRQQQEDELAARSANLPAAARSRIMSGEEIRRFVSHYERITRHMLSEMPSRAGLVVDLDADRKVTGIHRISPAKQD